MAAPATEEEILDVNRRYHDVAADDYDAKWGIALRRDRPRAGARQGRASCSARGPGRSRARWRSAPAPATSRSTCCRTGVVARGRRARTSPPACCATLERNARRARPRRSRPRPATPPSCRSTTSRSTSCSATPCCTTCPTSTRAFAEFRRVLRARRHAVLRRRAVALRATGSRPCPSAPALARRAAVAPRDARAARRRTARPPATGGRRPRARGRWSTSTRSSPPTSSATPRGAGFDRRARARRGAAGELVRLVQPHARGHAPSPSDIPWPWIQYAYRGYLLLQRGRPPAARAAPAAAALLQPDAGGPSTR